MALWGAGASLHKQREHTHLEDSKIRLMISEVPDVPRRSLDAPPPTHTHTPPPAIAAKVSEPQRVNTIHKCVCVCMEAPRCECVCGAC